MGDSCNVVDVAAIDSSNNMLAVLLSGMCLLAILVKNGLAKTICRRAHEATKHIVTTKQL